jgi:tRNA uridine 5-carbamoylmethylation protein Kti12
LVVVGVFSPEFRIIVQLKNEFDPSQPLEPGDPAYVDCTSVRGDDDITVDLGRTITDAQRKTCQIYSGHRGGGKSTELKKLKKWLEERGFFVVYFAAATDDAGDLNLKDTEYSDILLACARNIIDGLKSLEGLDSQPIAQWIAKSFEDLKTILSADIKIEELKTNVELQLSQFAKLTTAVRLEPQKRDQVRKLMLDRAESLETALNDLLANARQKLPPGKRDLVVMADNLDRISPVDRADGRTNHDEIFLDRADSLKSLNCHTIYTAPVSFVFSASASRLRDEYDGVERLPMVTIADRNHQMLDDGYAKLRDVLARRVAKAAPDRSLVPDVFADEDAVQRLCMASGGHMRELMRLVQESLKRIDALPIGLKTVQRAIAEARETYLDAIRFEDWEALMAVEQTKDSRNECEDRCRNLLFRLCVLEYREWDEETEDKITWAAVHPLIRSSKEFKQRWDAFQASNARGQEA